MDNLSPAGMLHMYLSICWMRSQVPVSIMETNRANSDSKCRKTKKQDRNILLLPNKSFSNKEKGTETSNRNSVIGILVPPILKRNISSFSKALQSIYHTWQISDVSAFFLFFFSCASTPSFSLPFPWAATIHFCVAYLIWVAVSI